MVMLLFNHQNHKQWLRGHFPYNLPLWGVWWQQPKQEKIYQIKDPTCLDAMQEQEHVLIEICKDTTWKDGDDHTLLLPFEMQE